MSRWFRHYAGMMRDDKLVRIAVRSKQPVERVVWVWGAILESAAEIDDAGRYELDAPEVAYFLRADEVDIRAIADGLADAGHVVADRVVKWGDRQYQSDTSKERQARYRERKRGQNSVGDSQHQDGDVTQPSRDGAVTPQETETELDKVKEEPNGSSKKRGCRLPPDWMPDLEFAQSIGLTPSQANAEAIKFREWWPAQPGQRGVKLDWGLTWQTWCRKSLERLPRGSPGSPKPERYDPFKALAEEFDDGQDRNQRSDRSDWDDAQGVPIRTIEHHR